MGPVVFIPEVSLVVVHPCLLTSCRSEFTTDSDAQQAFEDFLRAGKTVLTANEVARIRDHVGVVGMAGT